MAVTMVMLMIVYLITGILSHLKVKKKCEEIKEETRKRSYWSNRSHRLPSLFRNSTNGVSEADMGISIDKNENQSISICREGRA